MSEVICQMCGKQLEIGDFPFCPHPTSNVGVSTDDIPGGIEIRHAICNPDGTPKRYYSKTEIRRAANEAGYTIHGDTPKPYKVNWSGRKNNGES